ncbi:hypothetical protein pb186bvf_003892 [Paramecium bursaria]
MQVQKEKRSTFWKYIFAVTFSSAATKTIIAPVERIKLIIQTRPILKFEGKSTNLFNTFTHIYKTQGLISLWKGNGANIFRSIPSSGMKFTIFDSFKQYIPSRPDSKLQQFASRLFAGYLSGALGLVFNYPLDVIRVKLSTDMSHFNSPKIYKGILDCTRKTLQTQGVQGLYQGFMFSSLIMAPYLGTQLAVYDYLRSMPINNIIQIIGIVGISTCVSAGLTYPLDVVRRRLQINGSFGVKKGIYICR